MEPLIWTWIEDAGQFGLTPFRYLNQVPKQKKIYLHWLISLSKECAYEESLLLAPKLQQFTLQNWSTAGEVDSSCIKQNQLRCSASVPHICQPLKWCKPRTRQDRDWTTSPEMHMRWLSDPQQSLSLCTDLFGHTSHLALFVVKKTNAKQRSGLPDFPSLCIG